MKTSGVRFKNAGEDANMFVENVWLCKTRSFFPVVLIERVKSVTNVEQQEVELNS